MKQKRVLKSRIHVINNGGTELTNEDEVRASAASFFQSLLSTDVDDNLDHNIEGLSVYPPSVDLQALCEVPSHDEIRAAVFGISSDSTPGPDGFTSLFF